MYRYINGEYAYGLINYYADIVLIISYLLYFKSTKHSLGLYAKYIVFSISKSNTKLAKIIEIILVSLQSFIMAEVCIISARANAPFGELVGTGANYFGLLFLVPVAWFAVSLILMAQPIKQIDITTIFLPIHLFVVKMACFFNGCCWGIEWKYGLYNHHPYHSGTQVPIQAIEAFFALAIFFFLLIYRKKAKAGTMFPMYMILYSATRFPVEFLSAAHEKIAGPFNTYHFLCIAGVAVGIIMLIVNKYYGERMIEFFEKPHKKLEEKENELKRLKEEAMEADEIEGKEKIRLAREKAKARHRK